MAVRDLGVCTWEALPSNVEFENAQNNHILSLKKILLYQGHICWNKIPRSSKSSPPLLRRRHLDSSSALKAHKACIILPKWKRDVEIISQIQKNEEDRQHNID